MTNVNVVAIYPNRSQADEARKRLLSEGVESGCIRLSDNSVESSRSDVGSDKQQNGDGLFSWLFGSNVADDERATYQSQMHGARTAVSVMIDEGAVERVEDTLEQFDPIDVRENVTAGSGAQSAFAADSASDTTATTTNNSKSASSGISGASSEEKVIPIVEEKLNVGKQTIERRHRIRTRIIDQPIEQQVNLKDERVVIERRPVSDASGAATSAALQPSEVEIIERHEQPVVAKESRVKEEVVVRKDTSDRIETVRDTVRHTEVDDLSETDMAQSNKKSVR
jgi:stress response protein YsnF